MIDTDIHVLINPDELLSYIEPSQREWFRLQGPSLGLPDYPWSHPVSWFRLDAEQERGEGTMTSLAAIQKQVLDAYSPEIGILNAADGIAVGVMASAYRAAELARAHNDWIRERYLDEDRRLRAGIVCPTQDPARAAAEIRRCAHDPRFAHVLLVGGSERPYGDPRYLPIFEAADECGLPIAIHSGAEGSGIAATPGSAGPPTFYIEWHTVGVAGSIMAHLVSLLCHGVFERFPNLRVLFMEGGIAWLPGILWRLDTNWRALRVEVPWLDRKPSEVARDHVSFSTQPLEHTDGRDALFFEMLEAVGAPHNLCFASDYPHWDFDDPKFMLGRLPASWRSQVMHDNAAALYGDRLGLVADGAVDLRARA